VFWGSILAILCLVFSAIFLGDGELLKVTTDWKAYFLTNIAWVYILSFVWIIFFMLKISLTYGDKKIGGPDAKKEFSTITWISMLFSAGLGTGLLYSGTYEPMSLFFNAPRLQGLEEPDKLIQALELSYLHWGLPAWFVYSATGLIFALMGFSFDHDFQFASLIPKRLKGFRVLVNVFAIITILIGVITTFALAASQINAGLNRVFPAFEISQLNSSFIISFITLLATISVVSGLKKGIKILSQVNMSLVAVLFIYILFHTQIGEILNLSIQVTGRHLTHIIKDLTYTAALKDKTWIGNWTVLYWAWWGAWAPFVGLFIARISKGRTLKEFALGTIVAPTIIACVWFTVFGFVGYENHIKGLIDFKPLLETAPFYSLFAVLDQTSFPVAASLLAVVSVTIFYVTSSDSGSYVIDMIASSGKKAPHSYLRIFWSITEGLLALILFYYGGVKLIQNLVILLSLPVVIYICYGIYAVEKRLKSSR